MRSFAEHDDSGRDSRSRQKFVQNCGMNLHKLLYLVSKLIKSVYSLRVESLRVWELRVCNFEKVCVSVNFVSRIFSEKVSLISVLFGPFWPPQKKNFGVFLDPENQLLKHKLVTETLEKHSKCNEEIHQNRKGTEITWKKLEIEI